MHAVGRCLHQGSNEYVIEICPTTLFYTINTIYNVYMYMVLMTLLPFMFLLVLNAFIVVKQSIQSTSKSNPTENGTTATVAAEASGSHIPLTTKTSTTLSEAPVSSDDTITMIAVVLLFLFCNTLALVVNIIETFFEPDALLLNMLTDLSNFLVIFNSSVNCVIYYIFNNEYREILNEKASRMFKKLCCCCHKNRRPASDQQLFCKMPVSRSTEGSPHTAIIFDRRRSQNNKTAADGENNETKFPEQPPAKADNHDSPIWQRSRLPNGNVDAYWNGGFAETSLGLSAASIRASVMSGFEELCADLVPMDECGDEVDSGWDDEFLSNGNPTPLPGSRLSRLTTTPAPNSQANSTTNPDVCQSWIAEVQIMENRPSGRPHIYVKPISKYVASKMSITAL
uniref:G_PROTEIN_RECEP_F1_2 domain-containing protein n=1 Tax=Panagrellus redivivus TaxID=6233 RepID=A0A7E4WBG8_PANRE